MNVETALAEGREAARRYAWREAYELLKAADKAGPLDPEDLEALGEAAWWHGRSDECINARERAYKLYLDAGRKDRAALVALLIVWEEFSLRAPAVAQAWLKRAEQLLQDEPVSVAHGYLTRMQYLRAGHDNRERALELARETASIGLRVGDRDLVALGLQDQGRTLIAMGQMQEGMALLDEATMAAVSGELTPHITGAIYCNLIGTCEGLSDYRRAAEWTEAARRWCDRMAIAGFPGMCRVHRADVIRIRGAWQEAVSEARNAFEEL